MENISFYGNSLHHIDLTRGDISPTAIEEEEDLNDYIESLIDGVNKAKNKRKYKFQRDTTEVVVAIKKIINRESFSENVQVIANRLLNEEKNAQERINRLGKTIQKGSLLQSYLDINGVDFVIITKVDHNLFLDQNDLKKHVGLPFDKKVLKSCLIEIVDAENFQIVVYDSQSPISVYWWRDFLELQELNSDEKNTISAFKAIDIYLSRNIKKKYPTDHLFIRNALLTYFRTHSELVFDELINNVIGDYEPTDQSLNIEQLKNKINNLPEKKDFDRKFTIVHDQITAKQRKRVIPLHESIDLNIKSDIENLEEIITPEIGEDAEKYIKIRSDKGYDMFNRDLSAHELN